MTKEKLQFCDYCGTEIGFFVRQWREMYTCGARECQRWERDQHEAEREEAHQRLDEDMGWSR